MKLIHLISLSLISVVTAAAQNISSCGAVINSPGNYNLTTDLDCPSSNAITITASNVSFKLNGHIITGGGSGSVFNGISISTRGSIISLVLPAPTTTSLDHVVVQGPGLVRNFATGVLSDGCAYCQIALVTAAGNVYGIASTNSTFLTVGSSVAGQNTNGIYLSSTTNSSVQYNDASGNSFGIVLSLGSSNTVNNNTTNGNRTTGINLIGETGARLSANITNGNAAYGIDVAATANGNQIFNNTLSAGNKSADFLDEHGNCGSTLWSSNVFQVGSPACIH